MGCPLSNSLNLRAERDRRDVLTLRGLTIVEMLVAMSITLLIMAAVVTVFANISSSVTRRRATIEMSSALRNVRETLARDLAGATCPAVPWQRPESNHGYLEIIEGPQNDYYPTPWLWDGDDTDALPDGIGSVPGIDLEISSLPGSNLRAPGVSLDEEGAGLAIGSNTALPETAPTDGRGLGDADDTLMLTVRNETEPFVGRIPQRGNTGNTPSRTAFPVWDDDEAESPLAEVAWFAVENPVDPNRTFAFGEAGYRTIHRRVLLILPDLDYRIDVVASGVNFNPNSVSGVLAGPGAVRVLDDDIGRDDVSQALASLIAFQDRYDLSVRLEWNALLPDGSQDGDPRDTPGRWVLRANTLGDLTKRENRFEHHGYVGQPVDYPTIDRFFPFAVANSGRFSGAGAQPQFVTDPEIGGPAPPADYRTLTTTISGLGSTVVAYAQDDDQAMADDRVYLVRPMVVVNNSTDTPATARAVLDEDGHVVHVTRGLAPLGGARRGEDVMMTDALAFDLRVYDPGAPVYGYHTSGTIGSGVPTGSADQIVSPGDPSWNFAFGKDATPGPVGDGGIPGGAPTLGNNYPFVYQRQGSYVDLAYRFSYFTEFDGDYDGAEQFFRQRLGLADAALVSGLTTPRFATAGSILTPAGTALTQSYASYDTWSWHYENNGINEDLDSEVIDEGTGAERQRATIDEGTNGLDDRDPTIAAPLLVANSNDTTAYGPDDYAERETRPPYDTALRGLQVTLRTYERDSRQIREVKVLESFVPE